MAAAWDYLCYADGEDAQRDLKGDPWALWEVLQAHLPAEQLRLLSPTGERPSNEAEGTLSLWREGEEDDLSYMTGPLQLSTMYENHVFSFGTAYWGSEVLTLSEEVGRRVVLAGKWEESYS